MTEFVRLRTKTYSYLKDDCREDKKSKRYKKCVIKRKFKFKNQENDLKETQRELKINHWRRQC